MLEKTHSLADTYRNVWTNDSYRRFSPGLMHVNAAINAMRPLMGASFIDFGCGTGKASAELRKRGYGVVGVDFAGNCLDGDVDIPLLVADLTEPLSLTAEYGFCTDVMEHVETERVDDVLMNICNSVRKGIVFSIALAADEFGPVLIGRALHLTIKSADWWKTKLEQFWPRVEVLSDDPNVLMAACFTWPPRFREDVKIEALCNTPDNVIDQYIEENSKRGLPFIHVVDAIPDPAAVLVGGGPSLADTLPIIKALSDGGCPVFALNNAANYLKEHGITPNQIIIDSRPQNVEFVRDFPAKVYFLSAQCHPSLFDHLADKNVCIFYPAMDGIRDRLPRETDAAPLIGGMVTSGLQALSVCYTLGYRTMHLFGYDSSDADNGESHAYGQNETVAEKRRLEIKFKGKVYKSSFAMYKQAEQFEKFSRMLADHGAVLHVHGDGLLPAIARDIAEKQNETKEVA